MTRYILGNFIMGLVLKIVNHVFEKIFENGEIFSKIFSEIFSENFSPLEIQNQNMCVYVRYYALAKRLKVFGGKGQTLEKYFLSKTL